jgi:hypothetical protein
MLALSMERLLEVGKMEEHVWVGDERKISNGRWKGMGGICLCIMR